MQLGEAFVGEGANAAHVNTVLGGRDGSVGTAWATALAITASLDARGSHGPRRTLAQLQRQRTSVTGRAHAGQGSERAVIDQMVLGHQTV